MKRHLFIGIIGLGMLACSSDSQQQGTQQKSSALLTAPAELVSLQKITLGPPNVPRMWQFKIEYLAKENSLVKQGDLLVKFDGQRLKTELVTRSSNLKAAKKEAEKKRLQQEADKQDLILALAEAKMNFEVAKRKVEITDASRSEIERKKQQAEHKITHTLYAQAQQRLTQHNQSMLINQQVEAARIEKIQARVNAITQNIAQLNLKAPEDGMVIYLEDWEHNKPAVGETVYMGSQLISLPSLQKIAVKIEFDESDTAKVSLGQQVKVLLEAHPEKAFSGTITSLGQAYRTKSQYNRKIVFDAWVKLDDLATDIMRPGMKAKVELSASQKV